MFDNLDVKEIEIVSDSQNESQEDLMTHANPDCVGCGPTD